ncbi:hypothetical protein R54767_03250 [Paraburkholderia gardini]|uniref:Uncharacterized protein n=1 Tax=Paraburkholderia gardini TaxID=2823469 RepID=A0ABN7QPP2_9BURK|nr:hypothetical protein R54767_03250 [Paraburkholderia gardini]
MSGAQVHIAAGQRLARAGIKRLPGKINGGALNFGCALPLISYTRYGKEVKVFRLNAR